MSELMGKLAVERSDSSSKVLLKATPHQGYSK
jgi:hypothetical protein